MEKLEKIDVALGGRYQTRIGRVVDIISINVTNKTALGIIHPAKYPKEPVGPTYKGGERMWWRSDGTCSVVNVGIPSPYDFTHEISRPSAGESESSEQEPKSDEDVGKGKAPKKKK